MQNITILKADQDDLPEILRLQKEAFLDEAKRYGDYKIAPLTQSEEEILLEYPDYLFLKATHRGRIVGSVKARAQDGSCWVGRLIVSPEFRNQGIGHGLLTEIEAHFPGHSRFILFTGLQSENNIRLYKSVGYQKTETYADPNNPNLILVRMVKEKPRSGEA